ncbi:MAG: hypothetical protein FWD48_03575 [Oscillospiraceae bacterium]|nr:hypothetical protein [Oscillospiraceae bacterium]
MVFVIPVLLTILIVNIIIVEIYNSKAKSIQRKPRLKNLFFMIPCAFILINYALLVITYHIQNNTGWAGRNNIFGITGLETWNTALSISNISTWIIILTLIARLIIFCIKKINGSEFFILSTLNLIATFFCVVVITNRI